MYSVNSQMYFYYVVQLANFVHLSKSDNTHGHSRQAVVSTEHNVVHPPCKKPSSSPDLFRDH